MPDPYEPPFEAPLPTAERLEAARPNPVPGLPDLRRGLGALVVLLSAAAVCAVGAAAIGVWLFFQWLWAWLEMGSAG